MFRLLGFIYGIAAYLAFFVVFLWMVAFLGDFGVPKTVNSGVAGDPWMAAIWDLMLIALFGAPHTIMARTGFKERITAFIPQPLERSTYMWTSNILLAILLWQWQPINIVLWQAEGTLRTVLYGVYGLGYVILVLSTFLTDHFYLFGLKQITAYLRDKPATQQQFHVRLFYKLVRHPMMLGFLISFWSLPTMTVGALLFSAGMTIYILIGIHFEERGLEEELGADYRLYKRATPMLIPGTGGKVRDGAALAD